MSDRTSEELHWAAIRAGLFAAPDHDPPTEITPWRQFSLSPLGTGVVWSAAVDLPGCRKLDLVRTEAEHLAKFAHLRYLGLPAPTLPEIDGLRLDTDCQCQIELRPASFPPQVTNRLHRSETLPLHLRAGTIADVLLQLYYLPW
jgi:hypothetical protein